jgi:hypothetical protein
LGPYVIVDGADDMIYFFCRRLNQTMNDTLFDFAQILTIMVAEKLGLMHFFTQKFIF